MKKILFITNRNILTTSGELRLIKNRAETLYSDYGIASDFIAISSIERIKSAKRENIDAGGHLKEIPLSFTNLISLYSKQGVIKKTVLQALKTNHYSAVVLSGPGMAIYTTLIKRFGLKVYIDIHGAVEDALMLATSSNGLKNLKYRTIYHIENTALKKYLKYADGAFVVTNALASYIKTRYKLNSEFTFHIVPCATANVDQVISDRDKYRQIYRSKYNIDIDDIVFVYSGGISPWQCIDETIELYKKIDQNLGKKTRLLLFSHKTQVLKDKVGNDSRFIIDSHTPDNLRLALCAADFAFLLRQDCITNNVAFPNKYLEYVENLLGIITTPFVSEISYQVKKFQLGMIISNLTDYKTISHSIASYKRYTSEEAENVLRYNSFRSRLESFANCIE